MNPLQPEQKVRILIVDDDPLILKQISLILRNNEFDIHTANNGQIAIDLIREKQEYDLIVLDVMMPIITGLEVCREVRKKYNLFEMPIIISSALSDSKDIASGLESGANDYVTKPINHIELLARVKNLISLKQINDLARANEKLVITQSQHDSLTGLPNREFLYSHLQTLINRSRQQGSSIGVIIINIDNFKSINNALGYRIGDVFLQEITKKIKTLIEENDLFIHLHTDTFAILKPDLPISILSTRIMEEFARKLLNLIVEPISIQQYEFNMTASAGIAFYPYENRSMEDVLRFADAAMYVTKSRTQNSFTFHSKVIHKTETARFDMEYKIKQAIDNDQFVLYYQPQMSTQDERLVGVEALIRWEHPKDGLIFPGEFIPVAEESGLILDLSEWVIEQAVKQSILWEKQGLNAIRIGVNLSPQHFHSSNLLPYIKNMLSTYNCNPENLEMEITEGCIMADVDEAVEQLKEMRDLGLGLSVDDFGTGYSSLSYLKKFPIRTLKIDQSFIGPNISKNDTEGAIVRSIITLGHSLKLNVIAEGVETLDQLDYLKRNYCNEVQGFYYSRAVSATDFPDLLQNISPK